MSDLLSRAANDTACQMLNDIGSAGTQLAVWTMWAPKAALVPLTVGGLSYMANNLLCSDMPGPNDNRQDQLDGCVEVEGGYGLLESYVPFEGWATRNGETKITAIFGVGDLIESSGIWGYPVSVKTFEGDTVEMAAYLSFSKEDAEGAKFRIQEMTGTCVKTNDPEEPGSPDPGLEPYPWTDPETNCNYTLKLEGFVQQYEGGPAQPVWNIQSDNSTTRADGGRMGACNLSPTIYIGGNGDGPGGPNGPPQIPVPPVPPVPGPDGVPWWLPPLLGATTGALLNQIGRLVNDTFNYPMQPGAFQFIAPCDYNDEGQNEEVIYPFNQEPLILRIHSHQVAMMEMIQQHLNWKTPTCGNEKPVLEGQWVTTRWLSTEKMDHSGVRLRKLFRYRTKSTRDLGQLSAYWEAFTWEAGPVRVHHKGAWWGTPAVWASTQEEGQRVIRFAAAEAGLDPDQNGEWGVSSSRSPRYGMSSTMTIHLKDGFPWISAREGDSWPNTLARVHDSYGS